MQVIYHCSRNSVSAPVAAAIHLGKLPTDHFPTGDQTREILKNIPTTGGLIHPLGTDEQGHQVHILYRGRNPQIVLKVIYGVTELIGKDVKQLAVINTESLPPVRGLGRKQRFLCSLGRVGCNRFSPMVEIEPIYYGLIQLVEKQKQLLPTGGEK